MAPNLRPANGGLWDEYSSGANRKKKRMALDLLEVSRSLAPAAPAGSFQRYRQMRDVRRTPDEAAALNLAREKRGFQSPMESNSQFRAIEASLPPDLQAQRAEMYAKRNAAPLLSRAEVQAAELDNQIRQDQLAQSEWARKQAEEQAKQQVIIQNETIAKSKQERDFSAKEQKYLTDVRNAKGMPLNEKQKELVDVNNSQIKFLSERLANLETQGMYGTPEHQKAQEDINNLYQANKSIVDLNNPELGGAPQLQAGSPNQAPQVGRTQPQVSPQGTPQGTPQGAPQVSAGMLNPANMARAANTNTVAQSYIGLDRMKDAVKQVQTFGIEPQALGTVRDVVNNIEQVLQSMSHPSQKMARDMFIRDLLDDPGIQNLLEGEILKTSAPLITKERQGRHAKSRQELDELTEKLRSLLPEYTY